MPPAKKGQCLPLIEAYDVIRRRFTTIAKFIGKLDLGIA